jgi:hypothetical protein
MRIVIEEVEGAHYQDIILDLEEIKALEEGQFLEGLAIIKYKNYHIGIRLGYRWRNPSEPPSKFLEEDKRLME